jgi:hypothetical protein
LRSGELQIHFIEKQGNASRNNPAVPIVIGISIEPESRAGKPRLAPVPYFAQVASRHTYDQVGVAAFNPILDQKSPETLKV